ncbi:GNAT family N-acetyltransferase [Calycomorphotria hydatis]|uniref:Putative acetyltransferase n=1 Tax=Calycomorphotria hydatis TaxID=2528027 RepID=A0A517TDL6_9PLAN|nr:GNAT family N-acetyltransferase [Calycomorphotria hydatis]QDT66457.1 putative acetyltransferase [Calycomorphotria hydatis]
MIEYRHFHNADPPKLVALWHACQLGRGAAGGFSYDALEFLNFSQRYFDPRGLIVAVDSESKKIVGMVHAGFGPNEDESAINNELGVICLLLVHPDFRKQGVGRELLQRGEEYLYGKGAKTVYAGAFAPNDPFYVGLYGGSRPTGFLESDPDAAPFMAKAGYEPDQRFAILQRDIVNSRDPMNFRLVTIRRKMELVIRHDHANPTWWWMTRYGRMETLRFQLQPKTGGEEVASVTVLGLDLYLQKWQQRVIGLIDLTVDEEDQRKGYGQALLAELCRRLRDEMVTVVEAHVAETNNPAMGVFKASGFERVDTGIVYRKVGMEG